MNTNKNIAKVLKSRKTTSDEFKVYETYIKAMNDKQVNFARLPDITAYLKDLSKTAGTLYMFYVLKAKNETGRSFWATETVSKELNVTTKTINNANRELQDLGLIYRDGGTGGRSANTYLLPPTSFLITEETDDVVRMLNGDVFVSNKHPQFSIKSDAGYVNYVLYEIKKARNEDYPVFAITVKYDKNHLGPDALVIDPKNADFDDEDIQNKLTTLINKRGDSKTKIAILMDMVKGI